MKTIFILLPTGFNVRNFLYTEVVDRLLDRVDLRVIAITQVPDIMELYPDKSERLLFRAFPGRASYSFNDLIHAVLRRRFYKINETRSLKILSRGPLHPQRGDFLREKLLSQPLPRSQTLYRWLHGLEQSLDRMSPQVQQLFEQFRPSLVVSTHPTATYESGFLKYARKAGVTSVGMVKSWDVLTTKGYIPVPLDYYLVWNQVMGDEIIQLHGIPEDRFAVTGIPHFDVYADIASAPSREDFLTKHGLDPAKKTVLFATTSPGISPEQPEILRRLAAALGQGEWTSVQVLARLHQLDSLEHYKNISHPNLAFQVPGEYLASSGERRLLDPAFLTDLRDTLLHCDVVTNTASTMSLDAVAMDKPVVNIAFDLESRGYYKSCRRYYDFDHLQPILQSGATRTAAGFDDFLSLIQRYLGDPGLESLERASLRETMCYKIDGQSAGRAAEYLLRVLDHQTLGGVDYMVEQLPMAEGRPS